MATVNVYVCIALLTTLCVTAEDEYSHVHVGTVLFSHCDVKRHLWSKNEVSLLKARRYFQSIIPPVSLVDPRNEFVDPLLIYFYKIYSSVTSADKNSRRILRAALADALGGYLKFWVLPVTKLAYYGGVMSHKDASRVYDFYNRIKRQLNTDGNGWRNPDAKILNWICRQVPRSFHISQSRSPKNACDYFEYFERTDEGFRIPLPSVDWKQGIIFVPLKKVPLISLYSPVHRNILGKYYEAAKTCSRSSRMTKERFHDRFQSWLAKDVVPHIADDTIYLGLGNLLGIYESILLFPEVLPAAYKPIRCGATSAAMLIKAFYIILAVITAAQVVLYYLTKFKSAQRIVTKINKSLHDFWDSSFSNASVSNTKQHSDSTLMNKQSTNTSRYLVENSPPKSETKSYSFDNDWSDVSHGFDTSRNDILIIGPDSNHIDRKNTEKTYFTSDVEAAPIFQPELFETASQVSPSFSNIPQQDFSNQVHIDKADSKENNKIIRKTIGYQSDFTDSSDKADIDKTYSSKQKGCYCERRRRDIKTMKKRKSVSKCSCKKSDVETAESSTSYQTNTSEFTDKGENTDNDSFKDYKRYESKAWSDGQEVKTIPVANCGCCTCKLHDNQKIMMMRRRLRNMDPNLASCFQSMADSISSIPRRTQTKKLTMSIESQTERVHLKDKGVDVTSDVSPMDSEPHPPNTENSEKVFYIRTDSFKFDNKLTVKNSKLNIEL